MMKTCILAGVDNTDRIIHQTDATTTIIQMRGGRLQTKVYISINGKRYSAIRNEDSWSAFLAFARSLIALTQKM